MSVTIVFMSASIALHNGDCQRRPDDDDSLDMHEADNEVSK